MGVGRILLYPVLVPYLPIYADVRARNFDVDATGTIKESTIASLQPSTPFCFAVAVDGAGATLADCASPDAQFTVGFSAR